MGQREYSMNPASPGRGQLAAFAIGDAVTNHDSRSWREIPCLQLQIAASYELAFPLFCVDHRSRLECIARGEGPICHADNRN